MTDNINERELAKLHPELARRVRAILKLAKREGYTLQIVQGLRTFAEQDGLYAKGRTKPGPKVTNARGGYSWHNYGLAVDLAPVINGKVSWDEKLFDWSLIGKWAKAVGLSWGGSWLRFKDRPHVEMSFGFSKSSEALSIYRAKGLQAVWSKVKVPVATAAVINAEAVEVVSIAAEKANLKEQAAESKPTTQIPPDEQTQEQKESVYEEMFGAMQRKPEWFIAGKSGLSTAVAAWSAWSFGLKVGAAVALVVVLFLAYRRRDWLKEKFLSLIKKV